MSIVHIGQTLGPYTIIAQIGTGGMGTVYQAYQASVERYVAIKVLPPHLAQDAQFLKRFAREAKAIARLEHAHILPIYDYGERDGITFIAMRYVEGGTLKDRIAQGPLSLTAIARISTHIGSALAYAHQKGIIHRDLKPSNILLDANDHAYLSDFGLARNVTTTNSMSVADANTLGTPAYMSPEQGQGLQLDARADIYAFGVALYEMATGRLPYQADTPLALILKHIHDPLPKPRALAPQLPAALEAVILKAMAKSPAERYQTASDLSEAVTLAVTQTPNVNTFTPHVPMTITPSASFNFIANTPLKDLPTFIAGPPITHPARFFGRDRELRRIFNLLKHIPLQNAAIIGPRRSGKTSLLHYAQTIHTAPPSQLRPAQRADWLPQPERYRWIFVDFQDPRMGKREALLYYLLSELQLPVPTPCELDAFVSIVSQNLRTPTVVLFDEIGVALQRYPELDNAFWEGLRSLATNQVSGNLAFILAAHESPQQLAQHSGLGSPFFNIFGYSATLGPFTDDEARALITSSPIPFRAADVTWILKQSEGWPIRLQILCRECLLTLEAGEPSDDWRADALKQIANFDLRIAENFTSVKTQLATRNAQFATLVEPLSDRELEVLRLVAAGLSNQDIAKKLVIALSTVKTHINNIYSKLGAQNRTQAVARAREAGLL
jgi:serine/threonine protein kinase/DNA-binding CsgD family transcriptional regulator